MKLEKIARNPATGLYFDGRSFAADRAGALELMPNTVAADFALSWSCPVEVVERHESGECHGRETAALSSVARGPLVLSYGIGVDSTAILVGWHARGIRPDLILTADTGGEKEATYEYLAVIGAWLKKVGFPPLTLVRYQAKNFKHWPPYSTLEENCLTNGTLPSLAFGFHSCSLKWKVEPQDEYLKAWAPAKAAWAAWAEGLKVRKVIGYDAGKRDSQRYAHAKTSASKADDSWMWEYVYPL